MNHSISLSSLLCWLIWLIAGWRARWESWFGLFAFSSLGGYGAGTAQCSAKKRDKQSNKPNQLVFFLFHFHLIEESEIKLRNGMKRWDWRMNGNGNEINQMSLVGWIGMSLGPLQVKWVCFSFFFICFSWSERPQQEKQQEKEMKRGRLAQRVLFAFFFFLSLLKRKAIHQTKQMRHLFDWICFFSLIF